jgi:UDP-GlcNAc:undecaprenyl-phosphate GlcNAc-1-phosphate transferase
MMLAIIVLATISLVGSFALSYILTAIVRKVAARIGFVARPSPDRYHQRIVPLGGGIAIFATMSLLIISFMVIAFTIANIGIHIHFFSITHSYRWLEQSVYLHTSNFLGKIDQLLAILCCALILFLVGLWDDIKHRGPFFKLAVQFTVAIVAAALGEVRVEFFIENRLITCALSAVWIVLIINAFNFLDNMDGAAAGIAAIASCILFTAAAMAGQFLVGGLALVLIGTLLGFLLFNFPPAKIFMGDAGSLVVGFFVALLTLRTTYYHQALSGRWYAVFVPVVVMAVPLYDFVSVTLLRISQRKSPFIGDTQHFSHRLKRSGLTDTQTVLTLYLATLCTGLGATFLNQVNLAGAILIFAQTFLILAIIAVLETTAKNDSSAE